MLDKRSRHRELVFDVCLLRALEHKVISELRWRSVERHCDFFVSSSIIRPRACSHSTTRSNHLRNQSLKSTPGAIRLIVHHSFQQTQSFAAHHQSSQSCRDTSAYDLFSCRQRRPHDRLTHVCRLFHKSLSISRKLRQPIRELKCKVVESTGFTVPHLWSPQTSV